MSHRSPLARMRRLHMRGPRSRGLVVDRDGVALGPGAVLVSRSAAGYRCARNDDLVRLTRLVFAGDVRLQRLPTVLAQMARALDAGDLVKAQLLGLEIPIGELDDGQLAQLGATSDLLKGFDPNQPRVPAGQPGGGQWAGDAGKAPPSPSSETQLAQELLIPGRIPFGWVPRAMAPRPGRSGPDGATDIPSFARGTRPTEKAPDVWEKPGEYARRIMDDRYGRGSWENTPERLQEFRKIQKYGSRHWAPPGDSNEIPVEDDNSDGDGDGRLRA